jgi:hypothetical protein
MIRLERFIVKAKLILNSFLCFFVVTNLLNAKAPYSIVGEMEINQKTEEAFLEYTFCNDSKKVVKDFTIVFYVFDSDGDVPLKNKNNIVVRIQMEVGAKEELSDKIKLNEYLSYIPEEPFFVDYLYVSSINYIEGTLWNDLFGFEVF